MKVLHIIHSMDPATGGVARTLRNLIPALSARGVYGEILCFDDPAEAQRHPEEGCLIHRIGPSAGRWGRVAGFRQWLDAHATDFDLVVLHGLWLYNGYAYTKWLRRRRHVPGLPVLRTWVMPHGMLDPWFQRSAGRGLKAIRNFIYWLLIERRTIASADLILFTTEAERDKASITFPLYHPRRTAILPLGVPPPPMAEGHADAGTISRASASGRILALGRIDPKKGFDLLPEAWHRLTTDDRYRDRIPHLLIAGPGWDGTHGRRLKALIDQWEVGRFISTEEMLRGHEKWEALRSSDAVIMPSHQENFGLVAAEALACGTPLLLSDQVDIHARITSAGAGLSDEDTIEGVVRMVKRWIDLGPESREAMRISAGKEYLASFHIDVTIEGFIGSLKALDTHA
ncbi:MAG: glycosyltransferase [Chitinophagaceae bacterium]